MTSTRRIRASGKPSLPALTKDAKVNSVAVTINVTYEIKDGTTIVDAIENAREALEKLNEIGSAEGKFVVKADTEFTL